MFARLLLVLLVVTALWAVVVRPSEGAAPARAYVVQPGDTLWEIATEHYSGDPREAVWRIERANRLDGAELYPGDRLALP